MCCWEIYYWPPPPPCPPAKKCTCLFGFTVLYRAHFFSFSRYFYLAEAHPFQVYGQQSIVLSASFTFIGSSFPLSKCSLCVLQWHSVGRAHMNWATTVVITFAYLCFLTLISAYYLLSFSFIFLFREQSSV